jgi:NAD(P)-dependent dehydrogenase (short-subunit alcohol dehydrogenase family)
MEIHGKAALVTGGAHRVGRVLALALAESGADVLVNYHTSETAAADTVRAIEALGRRAVAVAGDVSDPGQVRALVAAAHAHFGRIDIVVNNASRFDRAPLAEITPEAWDRALDVNLKGPFLLAQAAASALRETRGTIVNIVDLSAFQPWPSFIPHAVSKAGLLHLTRCLARALAPDVRVNAIAPGTVLPPEGYDGTDYAGGMDRRVLARAGEPADVARALRYLVESDFVTGEVLVVDGGRLLL